MAETQFFTSGQITIVDLTDTATYIYYAKDDSGSGASIVPAPGLGYIGMYSGPTLVGGQPGVSGDFSEIVAEWANNGHWSGWLKYAGDRGYGCMELTYYAVSDSSEMPPVDGSGAALEPFQVLQNQQGENVVEFLNGSMYYFEFKKDQTTGEMTLGAKQDDTFIGLVSGSSLELAGASDVWKPYIPSLELTKGKWLWTKHCREYGDGTADIWYSVTREGADGRGLKEIKEYYCVNASHLGCTTITDSNQKFNDYVDGNPRGDGIWYSTTPPMDIDYQYLWNCEIITYTDGFKSIAAPALIASLPAQVQIEYALVDKDKEPEETDWEQGMPTLIPGKKIMMHQKLSTAQDWSTPIQISGEDGIGRDGAGTEFIYILRTKEQGAPETPDNDQELGPGKGYWSDHPLGVDENYQYEYVSVRTKEEGATQWGGYSEPAVLSKWGENGRDADTLIYIYSTKEEVDRDYPTATIGADGTRTFSKGWDDDMPSLSATTPVVYGSTVTVRPDATDTPIEGTTPVVWARWGQDGKGIEIKGLAYVFPGAEIVEGRDYVLYKEEDGKAEIEEALEGDSYLVNGYLFVYNGGNPVTFSCIGKIQGENGIGIDYVVNYYAVTETEDTPPLFNEVGAPHWVPVGSKGVSEKMPVVTAQKPYLWNYERVIFADASEGEPTPPVIIGTFGAFLQLKYKYSVETPNKPNGGTIGTWHSSPVDAAAEKVTGALLYMVQKNSNEQEWSEPIQLSGVDGASIEFIYLLSEEPKSFEADTWPPNNSEFGDQKGQWTDHPFGVDENYKYEYMSQRTKATGEDWGEYTLPALWSKWGENGQDADGLEYWFKQAKTEVSPQDWVYPEFEWNGQKWEVSNYNGWTPDSQGINENQQFEYSITVKLPAGGKGEATVSAPRLWARWGRDGDVGPQGPQGPKGDGGTSTTYVYRLSNNINFSDKPGLTEGVLNQDDRAAGWQYGPPLATEDTPYVFVVEITIPNGDLERLYKVGPLLWTRLVKDGTGVAIKGYASYSGQITDEDVGDNFTGLLDSLDELILATGLTAGDAYLCQGYLMVYYGKADQNNIPIFNCAGKIQGPAGEDAFTYDIQSNCETLKAYQLVGGIRLSTDYLGFQVFEFPASENSAINLTQQQCKFGYIDADGKFIELTDKGTIGSLVDITGAFYADSTHTIVTTPTNAKYIGLYDGPKSDFTENPTKDTIDEWIKNSYWLGWFNVSDVNVGTFNVWGQAEATLYPRTFLIDINGIMPADNPWEPGGNFKFALKDPDGGEELAVKIIPYENGISEAQATFHQTAVSINMAVEDKRLEFDRKGLALYVGNTNGLSLSEVEDQGLRIYRTQDGQQERVFWADGEGNLNLRGIIHAQGGEFTGHVTATYGNFIEGIVGGLYFNDGELVSTDGNEALFIDGKNGFIRANNIVLGDNAKIANELILYQNNEDNTVARLCNPIQNDGLVFESGKTKIYNTGAMDFGNLHYAPDENGGTLYAMETEESPVAAWSLTNEKAVFNNVDVKGTISTSVFKTESTQAVGGSMLFSPSYRIEKIETITEDEDILRTKVTLTDPWFTSNPVDTGEIIKVWLVQNNTPVEVGAVQGENEEKIVVGDSYHLYTVLQIIDGGKTVILKEVANEGTGLKAEVMVIIGQVGEKDPENNGIKDSALMPLVFGVNSGNTASVDGLLLPRGLTMTPYSTNELGTETSNLPSLFLGDLSGLKSIYDTAGSQHYDGYGLYCNNVYLTGALVTSLKDEGVTYFAGVSTKDSVRNNLEAWKEDTSQIVFWAGAESSSPMAIQKAPFQVTRSGKLYAQHACFEGSVIAKSEIRGTTIYAAEIHSLTEGNAYDPALKIYDTFGGGQGIQFFIEDESTPLLTIGTTGLLRNLKKNDNTSFATPIIEVGEKTTTLAANELRLYNALYQGTHPYLTVRNLISQQRGELDTSPLAGMGMVLSEGTRKEIVAGFFFSPSEEEGFATSYMVNKRTTMSWRGTETSIYGTTVFNGETNGGQLQYKPVTGGYDLYIV